MTLCSAGNAPRMRNFVCFGRPAVHEDSPGRVKPELLAESDSPAYHQRSEDQKEGKQDVQVLEDFAADQQADKGSPTQAISFKTFQPAAHSPFR